MSRHHHDVRATTPALERARNREASRRSQRAEQTGVPPSLDVHVDDLADGELEVETVLAADAVSELLDEGKEIEWTAGGDASVRVRLEREAGFVRVRGAAQFALRHPCVRCLISVPFEVPLDVDLRLVRREGAEAPPPAVEDRDDDDNDLSSGSGELEDLGVASYTGDVVHLADLLREQLFLELPMHPACDSARARPTAPCAYDASAVPKEERERGLDPRWAGLAKIKEQLATAPAPAAKSTGGARSPAPTPVPLPGRQTPVALPGREVPAKKPAAKKPAAKKPAAKKPAAKKPAAKKPAAKKPAAKKAAAKKPAAKKAAAKKPAAKKPPAKKKPAKKPARKKTLN